MPRPIPQSHPGEQLAELLRMLDMSQSQLAEEIGTTAASVSRIVSGKQALTLGMAELIAERTGARVGWLMTGELPVFPNQARDDMNKAAYQAGWRAAMQAVLSDVTALRDTVKPAKPRRGKRATSPSATVAAARRHRAELAQRGLLGRRARPGRRRKRA
jgi:transcriptional regulator with XRE-family HTH domain